MMGQFIGKIPVEFKSVDEALQWRYIFSHPSVKSINSLYLSISYNFLTLKFKTLFKTDSEKTRFSKSRNTAKECLNARLEYNPCSKNFQWLTNLTKTKDLWNGSSF